MEVSFRRAHDERFAANSRFHIHLHDAHKSLRDVLERADCDAGVSQFDGSRKAFHNLREQVDAELHLEPAVVPLAIAYYEDCTEWLEILESSVASQAKFVTNCGKYQQLSETRFQALIAELRTSMPNLDRRISAIEIKGTSNQARS